MNLRIRKPLLMSNIVISICILVFTAPHVIAKEIAFTFDDSPRFASGYFDGPTRAKTLINELRNHTLHGVVFFSTPSLAGQPLDQEGRARLMAYSKAGHIIANHTHAHLNINEVSLDEYIDGIEKADQILRALPNFEKWFRFPYLREGNTLEKRNGVRDFLANKGYKNGYITIDTYDWYMESLFQNALKKGAKIDMLKLRQFFVDTTVQNIEFADQQAIKHLGRSPKHVLLLHETDLSALFVGDLADAIRAKGWKIISSKEAYTDPIAKFKLQAVYPWNPGRVGEMILEKTQKPLARPATLSEKGLDALFNKTVLQTSN